MDRFLATVEAGRFVLDTPVTLPDGTRVELEVSTTAEDEYDQMPWPTTPEGIEEMIRELQAIEPAILTPEEELRISEYRAAIKAKDIEQIRTRMGLTQ